MHWLEREPTNRFEADQVRGWWNAGLLPEWVAKAILKSYCWTQVRELEQRARAPINGIIGLAAYYASAGERLQLYRIREFASLANSCKAVARWASQRLRDLRVVVLRRTHLRRRLLEDR